MRTQPPLPSRVAWRYAFAALDNAKRLASAARVLHASRHYGPARSLAISAREETGKFFRALQIALELHDPVSGVKALRDHRRKQAIGLLLARLHVLADLGPFVSDLPSLDEHSLEQAIDVLGRHLVVAAPRIQMREDAIPSLVESLEAAAGGHDEVERQRGLYVDVSWQGDQWILFHPADVTAEQTETELYKAEWFIGLLSSMKEMVNVGHTDNLFEPIDDEFVRQALIRMAATLFSEENLSHDGVADAQK